MKINNNVIVKIMDAKGFQRDLPAVQTRNLYKNQMKTSIPYRKSQKDPKPNLILEQTGIAGTERENTHVINSCGPALSLIGFKKNGRDTFFTQSCSLETRALSVLYSCISSELSSRRFLDVGYGNHD